MRKFFAGIVLGIISIITGCATSLDQLDTQNLLPEIDIVQLKENSDEALKLAQEAKLDVEVVNTKLTEQDNRLVSLSDEIAEISPAKLEELENRLALLIEAFKDLQEQFSAIEIMPQVRVKKTYKKKAKKELPTFSPSSAGELISSSEYEAYQAALRVFNKRNYTEASKMFVGILKKYPNGNYSSNAQYWIGECFYAKGEFANAIGAFKKVFSYKSTTKADDAQLKIGMSFLRLGKSTEAKNALKTLIGRYPNSEYVPRARKYINEIK